MATDSRPLPAVVPLAASGVRVLGWALPIGLAFVLVAPSIVWISLDRSVWPWDPSWYGEVSVDLWSTLRLHADQWPNAMAGAFGLKPPAVAWLGQFFVPLGGLVGGDASALLLSNVVWQATTLAVIFVAASRLTQSAGAAAAASLIVGSAPLFTSASHEYFVEPIQTLSIAWALLVLCSSTHWRSALTLANVPGVVALGLLTKLSTPPYMAGPMAGALLLTFRYRGKVVTSRSWWRDGPVVLASSLSALLVVGAIAWYHVNLHAAIQHYHDSSADNGLYGTKQSFAAELHGWADHLRDATFLPHVGLFLILLVAAAVAVRRSRLRHVSLMDARLVAALACVGSVALVLALFSTQPNQEPRYLLPLIPLVALIFAIGLGVGRSRIAMTLAAAVLCFEFTITTLKSFGEAHGVVNSVVLAAPTRDGHDLAVLDRLVDATCTSTSAYKINMVGADYPWFNFNTLDMLAAERHELGGRLCYYTSLGYAASDSRAAWQRVLQFAPPYYLSIDYGNPANPLPASLRSLVIPNDPFNQIDRSVYRRVLESGRFVVVPGGRHDGFVLLRAKSIAGE